LTPALDVLGRLGRGERAFLLESGSDADGCGAVSLAGCHPVATLEWRLGDPGDPFELLERARAGRLAVGYLGYGLASVVEPKVPPRPDPNGWPDLAFAFYDAAWRLEHASGRAELRGPGARTLAEWLAEPPRPAARLRRDPRLSLEPETSRAHHAHAVARLLDYIRAGDVYEVSLTHQLATRAPCDADALYAEVRRFRAPFGALIDLGHGRALVANSPERFLRVRGGRVESRPIKGTADSTAAGAARLCADPKERAEHVMIVDLVRNDLGRVCAPGSVRVDGFERVVSYPTVHHLISTVSGELRPGIRLPDLLRATFPGGSVTGAPKVRAMQVIAELEPRARGPYTGAFGWIGPGPRLDLELAMTIRTAVRTPDRVELGTGGAIVADSHADREWEETLLKARAFSQTFSLAPTPKRRAPACSADGWPRETE
jgi:para-aminobenzoate synthetase component 1